MEQTVQPAPEPPSSPVGRFFKGLFKSGLSSALMMGIIIGLSFAAPYLPFAGHLFAGAAGALHYPAMALVTTAIALFGGIMAVVNGKEHAPTRAQEIDARNVVIGVTTPGLGVAIAPDMASEVAAAPEQPKTKWTERSDIVGNTAQRDTIAKILADSGSDKSHAAKILEAQQANASKAASVA